MAGLLSANARLSLAHEPAGEKQNATRMLRGHRNREGTGMGCGNLFRPLGIVFTRRSRQRTVPTESSAQLAERGLILRVLSGERGHFHELLRRYKRAMYITVFSILRNEADAEEALQETVAESHDAPQSDFRPRKIQGLIVANCEERSSPKTAVRSRQRARNTVTASCGRTMIRHPFPATQT